MNDSSALAQWFRHSLPLALSALLGAVWAQAQLPPGNPLAGLERLKNFETRRASSSDPNWKNPQ